MDEKFYVYIIQSKKDKSLYTGQTRKLSRRIYEHNNGLSVYTKQKLPWDLVWYCVFNNRLQADQFEKYLKTGSGRAFIKRRLINILRNPP